jgi:tetratricopeptide (TPR) repeat protein
VIEQRLAEDGSDRHARFLKGVALAEKGDTDAAIKIFEALSRDYPKLPEPYNNLAVLYASKHEYAQARDALLQAINTHPSYATAHENLGDIYAKMAGLAYTRALSLDTDNAVTKDKLALIDDLFAAPGAGVSNSRPYSRSVAMAAATVAQTRALNEPVREAPVVTSKSAPKPASKPAPKSASKPAPKSAAQSVAAPAAAAQASLDGVTDAVQSWARAWASQDVERYLANYVPRKSPDASMSHARWEQRRRLRLSKPGNIEIVVDNITVQRRGPDRVVVTFVQAYRSDSYADRVRKRLIMDRAGDGWKISSERTIAKL